MNRPRLKRNATRGSYRVLEFAGEDQTHTLYTANQDGQDDLYWLLESNQPPGPREGQQNEAFSAEGHYYLASRVEGTSAAALASMAGAVDWRFIVPRWAALCELVGAAHSRSLLFQQGTPLDLNSILFDFQGRLLALPYSSTSGGSVFLAPEARMGTATPTSDVYALASALSFLLRGGTPDIASLTHGPPIKPASLPGRLAGVLRQATAPEPFKRPRDAGALALALRAVGPGAAPVRVERSTRALPAVLLVIFLTICVVITVGIWGWQGPVLLSTILARLTPAPLATVTVFPAGELGLDVLAVNFTPDGTGHLELRLTVRGKALSQDIPAQFELAFDGSPVRIVAVDRVDAKLAAGGQEPHHRLNFEAPQLSSSAGTYRITARVAGASLSKLFYFEPTAAAQSPAPNGTVTPNAAVKPGTTPRPGSAPTPGAGPLASLAITGLQVVTEHYPELSLYFAVSGTGGNAARLQGPITIQVEQDSQVVGELVMTPNDPSVNPITVALALDVSGSMYGRPIANAREAATGFVGMLAPKDAACLYSFSTVIRLIQPCSTDRRATAKGIQTLAASGNTSLYQALIQIADDLTKLRGRKAIVLLSDGADTASHITEQSALTTLKQTDIPVYAIGLVSYQFQQPVLGDFASGTSGSFLQAPTPADLRGLYSMIAAQLENQYRIDFKSTFPDRANGTITVRLTQGEDKVEAHTLFSVPK